MLKFFLWCILLILCWPLALLALLLYPIIWVLTLPFRIIGIAVDGVLGLLRHLYAPRTSPERPARVVATTNL